MRKAATVLGIIHDRGKRGLPLADVYRQMFNPELYLIAYGKLYRNKGATTPASNPETVDGMSLAKIQHIVAQLRTETFRWQPVKRVYVEKKNSTKLRPLGLSTWSDKLVQEVIRMILEAYYEPQFSAYSHGFRPHRGCHTALRHILHNWTGTTWFIEGDIAQCFDKLDTDLLLEILGQRIHDQRFLRLIRAAVKAGYLENWQWHATYSGTPQGSVVSPILTNIYLNQLDQFVEHHLLPKYNRGTKRQVNPLYRHHHQAEMRLRKQGRMLEAARQRRAKQQYPSQNPQDPQYRRLRYVRYADDFLLGFIGPKEEAEAIKDELAEFLAQTLKLELSAPKTLITHARTEAAKFLGYEVSTYQIDHKLVPNHASGRSGRYANGNIRLGIPARVIQEKCQAYMKHGKAVHKKERTYDTDYSILARYQTEYRGVVQYYVMASNLAHLSRLKWVMETSLTKTLAMKHKISVSKVYRRYSRWVQTPTGQRRVLQARVERAGRPPLLATWGGIPLIRQKGEALKNEREHVWNTRTELLERLLKDECELCGAPGPCAVHHVRSLKSINRAGRKPKPRWAAIMIARQRKTLVTCLPCHDSIHAPERARTLRDQRHNQIVESTGEPGDAKVSRPVRWGAKRKVREQVKD
jgi:group II intron reverse transcriptase/maturase